MMRPAERLARVVGVTALTIALVLSMWPSSPAVDDRQAVLRIDGANIDSSTQTARVLAARFATGATSNVVRLSAVPSGETRGVLGAAVGAGVPTVWQDSTGVRDIAASAVVASSPDAPVVLTVVANMDRNSGAKPSGAQASGTQNSAVVLRDAGGVLDSASSAQALRVRAAKTRAPLVAELVRDGRLLSRAELATGTVMRVRNVLLYARPGWDAKFVSAALEESGWAVDGTLALSPSSKVRLGTPQTADTSRYSAVVVLDSGLISARPLQRFVEQGGGVIVAGDALRDGALQSLLAARAADDRPVVAGGLLTETPRRGLPAFHLTANSNSMVMDAEGRDPVVVVARRGTGRVMTVGYRSTWRWRMEGRDDGADAHRQWWNDLVSAVAFASDTSVHATRRALSAFPGDAAPVADLYARLGNPAAVSPSDAPLAGVLSRSVRPPLWLLFLVGASALLVEWVMRRLRGAP